jgi:hypothetical protein
MWRPEYIYIVDTSVKYFIAWQECKGKPLLPFHNNTQQFYIVESGTWPNTKTEYTVVFS